MSVRTRIEWCDATWNVVTGCQKVSQGCKNCYAERIAERFWKERKFTDVQVHPERLEAPLHWHKPRRVFVNSMSDLFHPDVPFEFINRVFSIMALAADHTFMILTKRPQRMLEWFNHTEGKDWEAQHLVYNGAMITIRGLPKSANFSLLADIPWPLPNVWLGVSAEDQQTADERIPLLLKTPAAVRFVSFEPLLGPIDLDSEIANGLHALGCGDPSCHCGDRGIDWAIVGGESGPNARPMNPDWARGLRDQCQEAGIPFFFKQYGEWVDQEQANMVARNLGELMRWRTGFSNGTMYSRVGKNRAGRLLDGRTWDEVPEV